MRCFSQHKWYTFSRMTQGNFCKLSRIFFFGDLIRKLMYFWEQKTASAYLNSNYSNHLSLLFNYMGIQYFIINLQELLRLINHFWKEAGDSEQAFRQNNSQVCFVYLWGVNSWHAVESQCNPNCRLPCAGSEHCKHEHQEQCRLAGTKIAAQRSATRGVR